MNSFHLCISFVLILLSIQACHGQTRTFTKYANCNYNQSANNLLFVGQYYSDFACLTKCSKVSGCVIAVINPTGTTIDCRLYRGFFGLPNLSSWQIYDPQRYLYFRGNIFRFYLVFFFLLNFTN